MGLGDGDVARLCNQEGELNLVVHTGLDVLRGTVVSFKGRWTMRERSGSNVNVLHAPVAADMGESTSVHSTTVSIQRAPNPQ